MSICAEPETLVDPDRVWVECEGRVVAGMSAMNLATVAIVEAIGDLLAGGAWCGVGVRSPEHWVSWKANVSRYRAEGLVRIARRRGELPWCWALFERGRLTEDAMVRIAARVPADRDVQVAGLAASMTIHQLGRLLASLPPLDDDAKPTPPQRQRFVGIHTHSDGWGEGTMTLPPDEWALVFAGLSAARDAELRDRRDLPLGAEVAEVDARSVTWADALVRMASEAADGLDAVFQRTGYRGERNQVVLHHDIDHHGRLGPGMLHTGQFVDRTTARYLGCDAQVIVVAYENGTMLGIKPSDRTPNRRMRRALERRDGGCAHPLCQTRRWLHVHHIWHWEDDGPTEAWNLVCLCPHHHRALHHGDFTIEGNPETGSLVFRDAWGTAIGPPPQGADQLPNPPPPVEPVYRPPTSERMNAHHLAWN
jgi:hypothetical protein